MKTSFVIEAVFPILPERLYQAWLTGEDHGLMTGAPAKSEAKVNSKFTAWDGYIEGENLELEENKRIVQSWRTADFQDKDGSSKLEIIIEPHEDGCKLKLIHTEIPEGQPDYKTGWKEHYFTPMRNYFV